MPRSVLFWVIFILWFLSGLGVVFMFSAPVYIHYSHDILLLILVALLGWQVYGPVLKG